MTKTEPDWRCERCKRGIWNGRTKWVQVDNGLAWRSWFICANCAREREEDLESLRAWERKAWT